MTIRLHKYSISLRGRPIDLYVADQATVGLRTTVDTDGDIWVYGDAAGLNALAAVFDGLAARSGVAFLKRHAPDGMDLLIFRGAVTPLRIRDYEHLRHVLRFTAGDDEVAWEANPEMPEDWIDGHWKWDDQATFRAHGRCALISASPLGLRYCALEALHVQEWQGGHTHLFWCCTSHSVELTIAYTDYPGP